MMEESITSFIQYLTFEKHFSIHTISAYRVDLTQFSKYIQLQYETNHPRFINHQMIRSWLVQLMHDKVTARSINRKLSSLKSFYRFLMKEKVVSSNPLSKVQPPKTSKRLPVFVEEQHMNRLLDYEDIAFGDDFAGKRNKLILILFYSTGIRLSELIGLKTADIDFARDTLKVLGKRNKERIMPITAELKEELILYLQSRTDQGIQHQQLFTTDTGQMMYPKLVYNIVKKYLSLVTSIEKRSPHVLRHTFATHLLNKGADLNAIKELLGHANLAATQVYTHNSIERLKNIYKNKHPRA
ncbi:MAG: tyrosine-type recombinase/integrase [Bacteroidota bacterium]|jgi:integrase/recombinase XerC|nr:tyrosine-type recombinase/integrase [Sphingobacteriales bacterium]